MSAAVKRHPLVKVLQRERMTFVDLQAKLKKATGRDYALSSLFAWVKPKSDPASRGIPRSAAEAIETLYGVPDSAWSRVIPGK